MEVTFLGTGSAWALPEYGCECRICRNMRRLAEQRLRTALLLRTEENLLVDCGPDIRLQLMQSSVQAIDAVLLTHGHGDHYMGLDELETLRRAARPDRWVPIPTFASEATWNTVEQRFSYLLGKLLERRIISVSQPVENLRTRVVPFGTVHSRSAEGSVGYVIEEETTCGPRKMVYTSDFVDVVGGEALLSEPDVLIMESHFFHEPRVNRPGHMSLQRGLEFIRRWRPKSTVFLVHISDGDAVAGDAANDCLKKVDAKDPMVDPATGLTYEIPTCQSDWQKRAREIQAHSDLPCEILVPYDGLRMRLW